MSKIIKDLILKNSVLCMVRCTSTNAGLSHQTLFRCGVVKPMRSNFSKLRFIHSGAAVSEQALPKTEIDSVTNEPAADGDQEDELDSKIAKYAELAVDVETKKKILMILMEHEVAKLEGRRVPAKVTVFDMQELLALYSYSGRVKYLGYLFAKEMARAAEQRKREIRKKEYAAWLIEKETIKPPEHIHYGIGHNTLLIRLRRTSVMRHYNQKLANAVLSGQKFIIDVDFDCFMRRQDCNNCGEQLLETYSVNRKNRHPFDLYFCNVQHSSTTMRAFARYMPNIYAPDNFITLTDLSYLDMFPKEKLIYITPHAKEPLRVYDHDAIYIIGGLVDKCIREPVVMAKAKREGIRAVHLPYDEYLMWGRGNKSLPLNQLLEIMLEMKRTSDWNKAFKFVPQRKLVRSLDLFSEF